MSDSFRLPDCVPSSTTGGIVVDVELSCWTLAPSPLWAVFVWDTGQDPPVLESLTYIDPATGLAVVPNGDPAICSDVVIPQPLDVDVVSAIVLEVTGPGGAPVTVTVSGSVTVTGTVTVVDGGGSITVDTDDGPLDVTLDEPIEVFGPGGGSVPVEDGGGSLTVDTDGGPLDVISAPGTVRPDGLNLVGIGSWDIAVDPTGTEVRSVTFMRRAGGPAGAVTVTTTTVPAGFPLMPGETFTWDCTTGPLTIASTSAASDVVILWTETP